MKLDWFSVINHSVSKETGLLLDDLFKLLVNNQKSLFTLLN